MPFSVRLDLNGKAFGLWSVLSYAVTNNGNAMWNCRCACGTARIVKGDNLMRGSSTSCGCVGRAKCSERLTKHGLAKLPEYAIWKGIWTRCLSPSAVRKAPAYANRTPPEKWRDFTRFFSDMGPRPTPKHSIERIDNNKPYSKDNCKWATDAEQSTNTSRNRLLTLNGQTKCATYWERDLGFKRGLIRNRLQLGWSAERAMTTPVRPQRSKLRSHPLKATGEA